MAKLSVDIRVEMRKGIMNNILFWIVIVTIAPIKLVFRWLGKLFTIMSDLLQELCYRAWFKEIVKKNNSPSKEG